MNKPLALVIAGTVLMTTALIVIAIASPELQSVSKFSNQQVESKNCEYQVQQVRRGERNSLSEECKGRQLEQENRQVGQDLCSSGVIC